MRIDSHHHLWEVSRGVFDWPSPGLGLLYRDFGMSALSPLLQRHRIDLTILVQVATRVEETVYLLATARNDLRIGGVVGWVDLLAADAPARIAHIAADRGLVGLRAMVQDLDDDWFERLTTAPAFDAMAAHGLVLDALVRPRHLAGLAAAAARHPQLKVVLDHAGKPDIGGSVFEPWQADISRLSRCPNVCCKLSGLVTEAASGWRVDDLRPHVDHLLECFGASRLLWGSDWPVVDLAGGYDAWAAATQRLLAGIDEPARDAILGGNAQRVYLESGRGRAC